MSKSDLAHDSDAWRAKRDHLLQAWIGDRHAVQWILDYFDVCELFDDLIDKDKAITDERVFQALWECMYDMPGNPFFRRYADRLLPVIHLGINCWMDATHFERAPDPDSALEDRHFAYVGRAVYTQVIQSVIEITRGREYMRMVSVDVIRFFKDDAFDEYVRKLEAGPCQAAAAAASPQLPRSPKRRESTTGS